MAKQDKSNGQDGFGADSWIKIYFGLAVALIVFAYGVGVGMFQLFPYQQIRDGIAAARDWSDNAEQYARVKPIKHLRVATREGDGVTRYDRARAYNGVTLMSGMWGESVGVKLVDMQGDLLHEWMVSFNEIWPDAAHLEAQPHDWDTSIHGLVAYPNGDLIFNFEHDGLVRVDSCSRVVWKLSENAHHVVFEASDGNLWVGGMENRTERDARFPHLTPPFIEESLLEVSPDGKILRSISLLELFYNSGWEALLVEATQGQADVFRGTVRSRGPDITHLNDIEILEADYASAFPMFEEGDMMLSLRNLHLLLVIDPETETIKWARSGPWMMQHDPDFREDGKILVFDNRARAEIAGQVRGSRVLEFDPLTDDVRVFYSGISEDRFFTSQMGKLELLPNGNVLVAAAYGGRAFEVDDAGNVVWEYINRWSDTEVAVVADAQRFASDYFDMPAEACD